MHHLYKLITDQLQLFLLYCSSIGYWLYYKLLNKESLLSTGFCVVKARNAFIGKNVAEMEYIYSQVRNEWACGRNKQ